MDEDYWDDDDDTDDLRPFSIGYAQFEAELNAMEFLFKDPTAQRFLDITRDPDAS